MVKKEKRMQLFTILEDGKPEYSSVFADDVMGATRSYSCKLGYVNQTEVSVFMMITTACVNAKASIDIF